MTPTLDEFVVAFSANPDIWFGYGAGELQNYFEALIERHAAVVERFLAILEVALARGEKLGYTDADYHALWLGITGEEWADE